MIDEYKDYLKRNQEQVFSLVTISGGALLVSSILFGGLIILTTVIKFVGNSTELNVYRENLATFQKCAEKVTLLVPSVQSHGVLTPAVETYCGETPREPVIVW